MNEKEYLEKYKIAREKALKRRKLKRSVYKILMFPLFSISFVIGVLKSCVETGIYTGNSVRYNFLNNLDINLEENNE